MNRLYQDHYKQWIAETVLMLSDTIQLKIYTKKSNKQVITRSSCGHVKDGCITHTIFQDYNKQVITNPCSRVTSKVIQSQHDSIDIDAIVKDAKEFYSIT